MAWSLGGKVWLPVRKRTNKQKQQLYLYCRRVQWAGVSHTGMNACADILKECETLK